MRTGASQKIIVNARPRFEVDGADVQRLAIDLIRLETHHDEEGLAELELALVNWGAIDSEDPDFLYFDGETLGLGKEIRVWAGDEDNEDVIFEGVITSLEGCFPERAPPELVVRAEDVLQWARTRQRTRLFSEQTDADIAASIASDHGLKATADVQGPTHRELWQVNQSDLAFLRERARAVGARLAVEGRTLVFTPRRADAPPEPFLLTRTGHLTSFTVNADLAHQRKEVRVHGWSVRDKAAIHESADASLVQGEADGGDSGPGVLNRLGIDAIEELHLEAPVSEEEARHLAEAELRRRARSFVRGIGETDGTPALRVGSVVKIDEVGPLFSGSYSVCSVRHLYDLENGLRTRFEAERVGLGRPG